MEITDLERLLGKKPRGVTYELGPWGYTLLIVTEKGLSFYFTSEAEIDLEVIKEQ